MDLFVYGTLQSALLREAVAGGADIAVTPASLQGWAVRPLADRVVPLITRTLDAKTTGLLLHKIDKTQQERLDLFEGAFGYTLIRVTVETSKGAHLAQMYVPLEDAEVGIGQWSFENWENNHLAPTVHAVNEVLSLNPSPDYATLRRMWPMIEMRAWAKHRAATDQAPATLRHHPKPGDIELFNFGPPAGQFFRFEEFEVNHQRFNGTRSPDLNREIFVGTDAVMMLPYDAKRDRILMVEQLRLGPALRGDPNPWSLEPIAGMIDARETPLEAGLREAVEEAGLHIQATEFMMSFYPAPGGTTDFFTCYLGLCDLPENTAYTGGLDTESEDLRLHTLSFDAAMALVTSGEINAGPLITMLYWLDRERPRLRSTA